VKQRDNPNLHAAASFVQIYWSGTTFFPFSAIAIATAKIIPAGHMYIGTEMGCQETSMTTPEIDRIPLYYMASPYIDALA
jgi:hypothetical protein